MGADKTAGSEPIPSRGTNGYALSLTHGTVVGLAIS